jgi:hypothetical protein
MIIGNHDTLHCLAPRSGARPVWRSAVGRFREHTCRRSRSIVRDEVEIAISAVKVAAIFACTRFIIPTPLSNKKIDVFGYASAEVASGTVLPFENGLIDRADSRPGSRSVLRFQP